MAIENKKDDELSFKTVESRAALDYLLRTAQQSRLQLNMMADQKASILLGAEVVVLTLLLGRLNLEQTGVWPFILAAFVFLSAMFALMSVMPKYKIDLNGISKPNWLFFAFSSQISQEEYLKKMAYIAHKDERIYETIVNDLHQTGNVLYFKKFRYLNLSYKTLLTGILVTFIYVLLTTHVSVGI